MKDSKVCTPTRKVGKYGIPYGRPGSPERKLYARLQQTTARADARASDPLGTIVKQWFYAEGSAKRDLTPYFLRQIYPTNGRCLCCNRLFNLDAVKGDPAKPQVDKYHPDKGYTRENVWWICSQCNLRKQDLTGPGMVQHGAMLDRAWMRFRIAQGIVTPGHNIPVPGGLFLHEWHVSVVPGYRWLEAA